MADRRPWPPMIGVEGLLALAATVRGLREAQTGEGEGGGRRWSETTGACPPVDGRVGAGTPGVAGVSGAEPGRGGACAGPAGRADDAASVAPGRSGRG